MSMRAMVLGVFLLGLLGTGIELLLLDHTQGFNQLIPLVLFVMSLLVLAWHGLERKTASLKALRITMLLLVVSGIVGSVLHYQANEEFELEADPNAHGMSLFTKVLSGVAPTLAPGTMVQLGLLGLIYTIRRPISGTISKESL